MYIIKCEEMKRVITEKHFPWLSKFIVMDRLGLELSYHTVYLTFLDSFGSKTLNSFITSETVKNIRVSIEALNDTRILNKYYF